ncbi:MBL fold metallo-hydrolase [Desulfomonile tiedjei]|uniref:Zn-dependent hydrolase, glyoxylase n=1 Tax=Desulfomonile tiedjei (strain ATCC 49306 / DSM 6799 / DCB-1) TaxID=706587 RepID=I4CD08_DESTA|nr:MBL fold metallo-hydrolase [Desulfomonile tiedjei]AFM27449.1 Zn-dependent hydrolase, glyoxylase [Desulfomonile tiedjei DSM 6799]
MTIHATDLIEDTLADSGGVREYTLSDSSTRIVRIKTFCPDLIGPGPTNVYLIKNETTVMVDAGIPTKFAKAFFYNLRNQPMPGEVEGLEPNHSENELTDGLEAAGISFSDIKSLLFTHGHPDHFLLARFLLDRTSASISAHILDTPNICNPWSMLYNWVSRQEQMEATGMPRAISAQPGNRDRIFAGLDLESHGLSVPVDEPIFRNQYLEVQGKKIPDIRIQHLPGHSPGSIGAIVGPEHGKKVLLCGDVLLNPITPHPDDLLVYLQTLEELATYDDIELVLPAHGEEITDLKSRVAFLREHHRDRLAFTWEACSTPKSVWDIATTPGYFDTYVDPEKFNFLAGTEALVHMQLLFMVDGLQRFRIEDGVHYFMRNREDFDRVYDRICQLIADKKNKPIMKY